MTCKKCQGTGRNASAMAVRVKVPGMLRWKLAQPMCDACGGTGELCD